MEPDIVQELNQARDEWTDRGQYDLASLLQRASHDIQMLRSVAGAVSAGPSAAETLASLRHKAPDTN